ncbi:hypothetical protein L2725_20120 [Shewanella corallii]|uniref:KAP NTPase domain-containing protein n=1 Tax=Shewanella corallii TaxID=560080 RepID=A0ABT0NDY3_9GAMM|nr:hypothetical protein [Shewanella corallii]MCL2916051.1 hypothetical protein [Shewanella corallii]
MRLIFGDDNAEDDDLLSECFLDRKSFRISKPIITGKWGTGKTASIFDSCKELAKQLKADNPLDLWYMNEHAFDIKEMVALKAIHADSNYNLEVALQDLWRAEIIRALVIQLGALQEYYNLENSLHWKAIHKLSLIERIKFPIWKSIKIAVEIATNSAVDLNKADEVKSDLSAVFHHKTYSDVIKCIGDISSEKIKPKIAIEPIETPNSPLEAQSGIAQLTVSSLLNTYQAYFTPNKLNGAEIFITIPWHRYRKEDLNFPQKMTSKVKRMRWNETDLREFINKRIEYEFRQAARGYNRKNVDPWNTLYGATVRNDHCHVGYAECSFKYVLRHTHHRSRDIQRLARKIVEHAVEVHDKDVEDVLIGRGGWKIPFTTIQDAIKKESAVLYDERVIEGTRRYPVLKKIMESLYCLKVPFEFKDLKDRLEPLSIDTNEAISILWDSGFLGIEISPSGEQYAMGLKSILGEESLRTYEFQGHSKIRKWYFFEHNHDGDPKQMINRYNNSQESVAKYVLHAISFDKLMLNVSRECPIGV